MTPHETALSLDDTIRAEGQPLGRWSVRPDRDPIRASLGLVDWVQDPNGTHDAYEYRCVFYTLPHQDDLEQRLAADRAHLAQWRDTPDYQATVARITGQAS